MKHWPELAGFCTIVGLAVGSLASAGPVETYAPCATIEPREPGCSDAECDARADALCERYAGVGFRSYTWCAP